MKKIGAFSVVIFILITMLCPLAASALSNQNIYVHFSDDENSLVGAKFDLYCVGSYREGRVVPEKDFAEYSINCDVSDTEKMAAFANTAASYAWRDKITPLYSDVTDINGVVDFGGNSLSEGVYLITCIKHRQNDITYFCEPTLVILPMGNSESITLKPKFEAIPDDTTYKEVSYKVLKSWKDDDARKRPLEIEVELLKDGEVYDTVILDESNNWRYRWDNLSVYYRWTVAEKSVTEGYVVSLTQYAKTLLLTNDGGGYFDETTSPEGGTTDANSTTKPTAPQKPTEPQEPELPVTGMLMWPIPYLACFGMVLFIIGYVFYRKDVLADE